MRLASSVEDSAWEKTSATKSMRLLTLIVTMSGFQCSLSVQPHRAANRAPSAGFADRLGRHFERKIACLSTAAAIIGQ
jgi:hypothetical protein